MRKERMRVLVIGATGKQGGRVAQLLLKKGHTVRALTRKPDSPAARNLSEFHAEIVTGNLTDRGSLERALDGCDAVFSMSTFAEGGIEEEIRQGSTLADAVKAQGCYLVFTSVASADQNTGISFFDSKWKIEQYIRRAGVEACIIAPAYFMENVITYGKQQLQEGYYALPLPANRKLQQIALDDIAAFGVLALENKDRFVGTRTDLASDELTGTQAAEILSKAAGRSLKFHQVPIDEVRRMSADMATMFEWFERVGYSIDFPRLRKEYPEVRWHDYKTWAKTQKWDAILREVAAASR